MRTARGRHCARRLVVAVCPALRRHQQRAAARLRTSAACASLVVVLSRSILIRPKHGDAHCTERLLGLTFRVSPQAFFQVNRRGAELLYDLVRQWSVDDITDPGALFLFSLHKSK